MDDVDENSSPIARQLDAWLADHVAALIALRRDLHRHPELSGEERRTTAKLAALMFEHGLDVRTLPSGTGLIADLPSIDRPGEAFAVRADIDALAMHDLKDASYRSTVDGVSHACGHDVHTAVAAGTAMFLAAHRDLAPGALRFVFQPAEERVPGGALDVLDAGGLDGVGSIVGVHCEPKTDVGTIGLRTGPITSAADMVAITVTGPGGHTARPELTVDTVALTAHIVQTLPARVNELAEGVVKLVFGSVHGGNAPNAIPTRCELRGSVRTPSLEAWEALETIVRGALVEIAATTDATIDVDYTRGVPPTVNDAAVVDRVRAAALATVGASNVVEAPHSWGGDDFAWYTRRIPGAYVRIGVHDPTWSERLDLHAGRFDVDERSIAIGVRLLATTAHLHGAGERPA